MNRGEIETVQIGRRRLIILASYQALLNRKRGTPAEKPIAKPPLPTRNRTAGRSAVA
jgi:hypothetical protein